MAGHRSWVLKSLAMNAVGAALDYSTLLTARELFDLAPAAATALGLTVGSTTSFLLNRRFAFGDARGGMTGQALRFALSMVLLLTVHSFAVSSLCDLGLHVVLAKMVADLTVLPVPQAFLLRRFVFPTRRTVTAEQRLAIP